MSEVDADITKDNIHYLYYLSRYISIILRAVVRKIVPKLKNFGGECLSSVAFPQTTDYTIIVFGDLCFCNFPLADCLYFDCTDFPAKHRCQPGWWL